MPPSHFIIIIIVINVVSLGLYVLAVLCNLFAFRWSFSIIHLFLGQPISLFPWGWYCNASFGLAVAFHSVYVLEPILCEVSDLIYYTVMTLFLMSTFLCLPHLVRPRNGLWRRICAASVCFLSCSLSTARFIPLLKDTFLILSSHICLGFHSDVIQPPPTPPILYAPLLCFLTWHMHPPIHIILIDCVPSSTEL
jgi:hypothetical protein